MIKKIKQIFIKNNDQMPLALIFALVLFFWAIFDSIMQYITPLIIQQQGFSNSMIGLIMGFSSIAGAVFDFFVYRVFKTANFRTMILVMFAICFAYPLLLWETKSIWLFLFAMAVWGIYYDLYGFGAFNFITKRIRRENYASSFGVLQIFKSLANIIAPLIIAFLVIDTVDFRPFAIGWVSLGIGFLIFIYLVYSLNKNKLGSSVDLRQYKNNRNILSEFKLWLRLGGKLRPVLVMVFFYHIIDAFFWTLIPLYVESIHHQQLGGLFLAAYSVPALIAGWFVGSATRRYGKKRLSYISLLIGSIVLTAFFFIDNNIVLIAVVFLSSFFIKMTHPVMNSSFADYINDAPEAEIEIEGLEDFSTNIGYIIGPIMAGFAADLFGMQQAFGIIGIIGAYLAIWLLIFAPKHIILDKKVDNY